MSFIDHVFPWLREAGTGNILARVHAGQAAGLLEFVDRIPGELFTLSGRLRGRVARLVSLILRQRQLC